MKKTMIIALLSVVFLMLSCGSGPTCTPHKGPKPLSYQVTFVESSGTGEMMVRATGMGCTLEQASLDAKRAAIWFVLEGGDKPILKSAGEKMKAVGMETQMFENPGPYIRHQSPVKSKTREAGKLKVAYVIKLDVAMITEKMASIGVITSEEDLGEELGLPTLAVMPKTYDQFSNTTVTVMQEYLQDKSFEVLVVSQANKVNNLVQKLSTLEGAEPDPMHDMALSLGSDIYVTISSSLATGSAAGMETAKASVQIQAYETATGKLVASTSAYSPERQVTDKNALIQEATNDAAAKVVSQIKKEWMKMAKKGKPFKLTVLSNSADGPAVDAAVYSALKALSKRPIKRTAGGKASFSYIAWIKNLPNAYELFGAIKQHYKGPGSLEKVSDTGSFLVLKAAGNGEIEITIE